MSTSFFSLLHQDKNSRARTGVITTDHGVIQTPMFMPVGTQGSVKTLDQSDLEAMHAQIILGNTYHLHLRPGAELIAEQGGLHRFMHWARPILTDSGGFQVFSLGTKKQGENNSDSPPSQGHLVTIDEEGVTFTSHLDGSRHRFTPETAIDIQKKIGADIIMAFDECTRDTASYDTAVAAMERTHRWAKRSLEAHLADPAPHGYRQFLFGIVQGAKHRELREASARFTSSLDFDGIALGGESIGYNMAATAEILDWVYPLLPPEKPHYAMGLGLSPADLLVAIEHGVDMFDCVAPTRLARHGMLYVSPGTIKNQQLRANRYRLNIKNARFKKDLRPIDESCACSTCQNYTRSYLHHLFAAEELSALRLASIHNLQFLLDLMTKTREAIASDAFTELKKDWIPA